MGFSSASVVIDPDASVSNYVTDSRLKYVTVFKNMSTKRADVQPGVTSSEKDD
jgi:hypothetical protein